MKRRMLLTLSALAMPMLPSPGAATSDWRRGIKVLRFCGVGPMVTWHAAAFRDVLRVSVKPCWLPIPPWDMQNHAVAEQFRLGRADMGITHRTDGASWIAAHSGGHVLAYDRDKGLISGTLPAPAIAAIREAWDFIASDDFYMPQPPHLPIFTA